MTRRDPKTYLAGMGAFANSHIEDANRVLAKFTDKLAVDPNNAFEWSDKVMSAAAKKWIWTAVEAAAMNGADEFDRFVESVRSQMLSWARNAGGSSSGFAPNAMRRTALRRSPIFSRGWSGTRSSTPSTEINIAPPRWRQPAGLGVVGGADPRPRRQREETMFYADLIRRYAPGHDPRLVEAWMRLERGTLDSLTRRQFRTEVRMACKCIDADLAASERLADSVMGPAR